MIKQDETIKIQWGVKDNVQLLLDHGSPVEFYTKNEPKYLGRVITTKELVIYKLEFQDFVSGQLNRCMPDVLKVNSDDFIWDFQENCLVYDFKTREKSKFFSVFPKYSTHFTNVLSVLPDHHVVKVSNSTNLTSVLFALHYFQFLNGTFTKKYDGLENTIKLIESVFGLPKSDLYTHGYTEIKALMPKIKMKKSSYIDKSLLEHLVGVPREEKKTYLLSEIIKTTEIPQTKEREEVIIDDAIYEIKTAFLLEGILYLEVGQDIFQEDLEDMLSVLGLDDEKVIFMTSDLDALVEIENEENWEGY